VKKNSVKTCEWLSSTKTPADIVTYCSKYAKWGKINGVVKGPPGFVCRATCADCNPCYQHKKTMFYYKENSKGKALLKNCSWLDKQSKKGDICSDGKTNGVYPPAHEACPTSCSVGSC